eukprot:PhM_4_TR15010/c0_g1_i1/m.33765
MLWDILQRPFEPALDAPPKDPSAPLRTVGVVISVVDDVMVHQSVPHADASCKAFAWFLAQLGCEHVRNISSPTHDSLVSELEAMQDTFPEDEATLVIIALCGHLHRPAGATAARVELAGGTSIAVDDLANAGMSPTQRRLLIIDGLHSAGQFEWHGQKSCGRMPPGTLALASRPEWSGSLLGRVMRDVGTLGERHTAPSVKEVLALEKECAFITPQHSAITNIVWCSSATAQRLCTRPWGCVLGVSLPVGGMVMADETRALQLVRRCVPAAIVSGVLGGGDSSNQRLCLVLKIESNADDDSSTRSSDGKMLRDFLAAQGLPIPDAEDDIVWLSNGSVVYVYLPLSSQSQQKQVEAKLDSLTAGTPLGKGRKLSSVGRVFHIECTALPRDVMTLQEMSWCRSTEPSCNLTCESVSEPVVSDVSLDALHLTRDALARILDEVRSRAPTPAQSSAASDVPVAPAIIIDAPPGALTPRPSPPSSRPSPVVSRKNSTQSHVTQNTAPSTPRVTVIQRRPSPTTASVVSVASVGLRNRDVAEEQQQQQQHGALWMACNERLELLESSNDHISGAHCRVEVALDDHAAMLRALRTTVQSHEVLIAQHSAELGDVDGRIAEHIARTESVDHNLGDWQRRLMDLESRHKSLEKRSSKRESEMDELLSSSRDRDVRLRTAEEKVHIYEAMVEDMATKLSGLQSRLALVEARPTVPCPSADAVAGDVFGAKSGALIQVHDEIMAEVMRLHDKIEKVSRSVAETAALTVSSSSPSPRKVAARSSLVPASDIDEMLVHVRHRLGDFATKQDINAVTSRMYEAMRDLSDDMSLRLSRAEELFAHHSTVSMYHNDGLERGMRVAREDVQELLRIRAGKDKEHMLAGDALRTAVQSCESTMSDVCLRLAHVEDVLRSPQHMFTLLEGMMTTHIRSTLTERELKRPQPVDPDAFCTLTTTVQQLHTKVLGHESQLHDIGHQASVAVRKAHELVQESRRHLTAEIRRSEQTLADQIEVLGSNKNRAEIDGKKPEQHQQRLSGLEIDVSSLREGNSRLSAIVSDHVSRLDGVVQELSQKLTSLSDGAGELGGRKQNAKIEMLSAALEEVREKVDAATAKTTDYIASSIDDILLQQTKRFDQLDTHFKDALDLVSTDVDVRLNRRLSVAAKETHDMVVAEQHQIETRVVRLEEAAESRFERVMDAVKGLVSGEVVRVERGLRNMISRIEREVRETFDDREQDVEELNSAIQELRDMVVELRSPNRKDGVDKHKEEGPPAPS